LFFRRKHELLVEISQLKDEIAEISTEIGTYGLFSGTDTGTGKGGGRISYIVWGDCIRKGRLLKALLNFLIFFVIS